MRRWQGDLHPSSNGYRRMSKRGLCSKTVKVWVQWVSGGSSTNRGWSILDQSKKQSQNRNKNMLRSTVRTGFSTRLSTAAVDNSEDPSAHYRCLPSVGHCQGAMVM